MHGGREKCKRGVEGVGGGGSTRSKVQTKAELRFCSVPLIEKYEKFGIHFLYSVEVLKVLSSSLKKRKII